MSKIILGLNLGKTKFGKKLFDGGAALIRDGVLLGAVAEERLSRIKYAGGAVLAMRSLLNDFCIGCDEVDLVVVSTCCEEEHIGNLKEDFPQSEIITCNHHLSHAYGSFISSCFNEAIIMVMDGGGNITGNTRNNNWWSTNRDQQVYYIGNANNISVYGKDFEGPFEAGIGEIYRAFTYFLGWHSSRKAGKLMSLAAYGNPSTYPTGSLLWVEDDGVMRSSMECNPSYPVEMIVTMLRKLGLSNVQPRDPDSDISKPHYDIAAWVQDEVERALVRKTEFLISQTNIRNVCIAGGVAYNCRAVGVLSRLGLVDRIFVSPAAGDQGQCLGNAFYGATIRGCRPKLSKLPPYLGPIHTITHRHLVDAAAKVDSGFKVTRHNLCERLVAEKLASGSVGAIFQGRSEFGLRALGNRSIVAVPRDLSVKERINRIKDRELFMPFAPVVCAESASPYFEIKDDLPYMTVAVPAKELCKQFAPAVVHEDGTARVQTLAIDDNPLFYSLLKEVERLTYHPILLNTSFNSGTEPIVESVDDAMLTFKNMELDFLWIGDSLIEKQPLGISLNEFEHISSVTINSIQFKEAKIRDLPSMLRAVGINQPHLIRNLFMLYRDYIDLFRSGRKITTIRYRKDAIDIPSQCVLPLYSTEGFRRDSDCEYVGVVHVTSLNIVPFSALSTEDALRDGFENVNELKGALASIYGAIGVDDLISIYGISELVLPYLKA